MKIINFILVSHFNFFFFDFIDEFSGFIVIQLLNEICHNCKVYLFSLKVLFIFDCDQISNYCLTQMMERFFIQLLSDFLNVFINLLLNQLTIWIGHDLLVISFTIFTNPLQYLTINSVFHFLTC